MADQLKDLQFYLDNPNEVPDDPLLLGQLAERISSGSEVAAKTPDAEQDAAEKPPVPSDQTKEAEAKPAGEEKPAADGKPDGEKQEEEAPIATRDGKRTIPYDVLRTERGRRQAAENAVGELSARLDELQAQLAQGTAQGDKQAAQTAEAALDGMSAEELEALREDFPVFGKVIDQLLSRIHDLADQVTDLSARETTREQSVRQNVQQTVQELIDEQPVLAYLQTQEPALFTAAVELDATLAKDPRYSDLATRFTKVAELMDQAYGPFPIAPPVAEKPAEPAAPSKPSVQNKEAARKAVIDTLNKAQAKPATLSDIPAGDLPESDELLSLENMSATEVGDRLMKMTPEQREKFLNRL